MIPNLDRSGRRSSETPWIRTKADEELKGCHALKATVQGESYPIWRMMEGFLRVVDKEGNPVAFELNAAQRKTYLMWEAQYREKGYVRCNEGKGRQMGSSTLIHAFGFLMMATRAGFKIGILADTEAKGKGLLQKYKFFLQNLPEPFRSVLLNAKTVDSASMLAFDFGDGLVSSVEVIVADENAGASKTFQMLHCSEVALWEKIGPTLTALERTVGNVPNTFIFRETTARGPNEWKRYYEAGKTAGGRFRSVFLAWWLDDTYESRYDGHVLNRYERYLRDVLKLPLAKIQWWHEEYHDCHEDLRYMKQEFPSTEAEMWQSTSVGAFDAAVLAKRKEEVSLNPKRGCFEWDGVTYGSEDFDSAVNVMNPTFIPDEVGDVAIFEEPIEGHPYALSNDPASGGKDYFVTQVVDCSNDRQVAMYRRQKADADEATFSCYALWLYYKRGGLGGSMDNRVYVTGERNTTSYWLRLMQRCGAGPVSRDRQDTESAAVTDHLGWRTTPSNRMAMIQRLGAVLRVTEGRTINDYDTLCEMEAFQYVERPNSNGEKAMAINGAHDDTVMALAGYFHCKDRGDFECDVRQPKTKGGARIAWNPLERKAKPTDSGRFVNW